MYFLIIEMNEEHLKDLRKLCNYHLKIQFLYDQYLKMEIKDLIRDAEEE